MTGANLLLDTNIIIYYLKGHEKTVPLILNNNISISAITEIEVLRYKNNTEEDLRLINLVFSSFRIVEMN